MIRSVYLVWWTSEVEGVFDNESAAQAYAHSVDADHGTTGEYEPKAYIELWEVNGSGRPVSIPRLST